MPVGVCCPPSTVSARGSCKHRSCRGRRRCPIGCRRVPTPLPDRATGRAHQRDGPDRTRRRYQRCVGGSSKSGRWRSSHPVCAAPSSGAEARERSLGRAGRKARCRPDCQACPGSPGFQHPSCSPLLHPNNLTINAYAMTSTSTTGAPIYRRRRDQLSRPMGK